MNKLNLKNKKQGFTIIEVVLVLAIAGLIFLIVFMALPGLQKSRRDTQRKSDLGNMAAALENYASNNNGAYPANPTGGTDSQITALLPGFTPEKDPQGASYMVFWGYTGAPAPSKQGKSSSSNQYYVNYQQGGTCNDNNEAVSGSGGAQRYAISMKLESGSQCKAT